MRVLFVTPNPSGSGEAVTALHMGRELRRSGHEVRYLASAFTAGFLRGSFPDGVDELCGEPVEDRRRWEALLRRFHPGAVVFADYPLLHLSSQGRALLAGDGLALGGLDAELVTLDHLGLAQGPLTLSLGPPHLEPYPVHLPALPPRMKVLLPCPVQSPEPPPERRGKPFRYWQLPLGISAERRESVRRRFVDGGDDLLVFQTVSTWAQELSRRHALPHYRYLGRVLESYFEGFPRPVTIVSVSQDFALAPRAPGGPRNVNVSGLEPGEFEELLFASDLMLTDNGISVSLGKAVCGSVPCAALRNSFRFLELLERTDGDLRRLLLAMEAERAGAVFPFEVFPIWGREDLDALGLFAGNPLTECVAALELYGGEETREELASLLTDPARREGLQSRQRDYVSSLESLPDPEKALLALLD